jgi:hypothetical protein
MPVSMLIILWQAMNYLKFLTMISEASRNPLREDGLPITLHISSNVNRGTNSSSKNDFIDYPFANVLRIVTKYLLCSSVKLSAILGSDL